MQVRYNQIFLIIEALLLMLCFFPELYKTIALCVFIVSMLRLMQKIGNGSFFLELLYVYTCFTCAFMPFLGYVFFNKSNFLAVLWVRYMPIDELSYFSFVLPCVLLFGVAFFALREKSPDGNNVINSYISRIRVLTLSIRPSAIITLTIVSLIAYSISNLLPQSFRQVGIFLYNSLFAGLFYIIYKKDFPGRTYYAAGIILFIVADALAYGMFTIIAYMGGLFLILLLSGKKVSFVIKFLMIVFGITFIGFLQLYKLDLRSKKKTEAEEKPAAVLMNVIATTQNSTFEKLVFPLYYRMNQGFNIALVQRRIPSRVDYLGGERLALTFASAFVPRLFWSDKPEAGGVYNMKLYAGAIIKNWSTNVGPIGEAYGNFGYIGGWIYILCFGLFLRFSYLYFLKICQRRPIFFLWMPPLFFQTIYVMETDSLQAFNSLIKGAIFLYLMFKLFPSLFPSFKTK